MDLSTKTVPVRYNISILEHWTLISNVCHLTQYRLLGSQWTATYDISNEGSHLTYFVSTATLCKNTVSEQFSIFKYSSIFFTYKLALMGHG